jgi:hypothetical protein
MNLDETVVAVAAVLVGVLTTGSLYLGLVGLLSYAGHPGASGRKDAMPARH